MAMAQNLTLVQNFYLRMEFMKNILFLAAYKSSSLHFDNKGKDILILGE